MHLLPRWRSVFVLALLVSVSPASAVAGNPAASYPACTKKPTAVDAVVAKAAHRAAVKAYERGDYDEAIRRWNEAYSADCTADALLFNIARAYVQKGDKQAALAVLSTYLQRTGAGPGAAAQIQSVAKQMGISLPPQMVSPTGGYPACDHAPSPEDKKRAQPMLKAGAEAYYAGDHDKAVKLLRAAYEADCTALSVLVNIGRAYEKKGDKPAALTAYQTYLQRSGPDPAIEAKIKELSGAQKSAPTPPAGARR